VAGIAHHLIMSLTMIPLIISFLLIAAGRRGNYVLHCSWDDSWFHYDDDDWNRALQVIGNFARYQRSVRAWFAIGMIILVDWLIDLSFGLYSNYRLAKS
jgi:hypothetical protein